MRRQIVTGLALSVLGLTVFGLAGCGGSAASGSNLNSGAGAKAPMLVTVGDAPLSNILAAKVTISALSLSNGSGTVALLSHARTVELSGLGATREPLELDDIPMGDYSSLTLTVSAASATYVNGSGQTVTATATLIQPTVTVALNPALSVTTEDGLELQLDFNLAQSFDLTNNSLSFTPALSTAAAKVDAEDSGDKEVEVTGSVVSVSPTAIVVQSADSGDSFTFAINSSTQFEDALTLAAIQTNAIVEVHGVIESDGSLLATEIGAEMAGAGENASQQGAAGTVTAVTTDNSGAVTSFTLAPREEFGGSGDGQPLTVSLDSSTIYNVSTFAAMDGLTAAQFTNAEIFPGQSVIVLGTTTGTAAIGAQEVDLAPETASGQLAAAPLGSAPNYSFTLQLASSSYLTTYLQLMTLNVAANANTIYGDTLSASGFASTAAGTALNVNGFLLKDTSGNFTFYAAVISQPEAPETPESGD